MTAACEAPTCQEAVQTVLHATEAQVRISLKEVKGDGSQWHQLAHMMSCGMTSAADSKRHAIQ